MRNKQDELFKFIKEWENKDYDEFNRNFEAFVEKLELSYEETNEFSYYKKVDDKWEWAEDIQSKINELS